MSAEDARGGELTEFVADHLLRDEDGHVLPAVVDGDRVPDHLGEDGGGTGPGADDLLRARSVHALDPLQQPLLDERPLLRRSGHLPLLLPTAPAADDQLVGFLVLATGALAERRHPPGRDRVTAALRLALAAPVRVVDRVHRRAPHSRPAAAPTATARLSAGDVLVVDVSDLPDGGSTG